MFLSIVIPIWNDERYLNECLDSCLDQALSPDDYEIICVDDGSTDRTPEILKEYAARYPNITVITKQHGSQYGKGRNLGFEATKGDFVWFVDHDDIVAPHAVDSLKEFAAQNSSCERIEFPCYKFIEPLTEEERGLIRSGGLRHNFFFPPLDWFIWSSIIKTSFLHEHQLVPNSSRGEEAAAFWGIEDFPIWGGDWVFIDECKDHGIRTCSMHGRPLYHYRNHENSATRNASAKAAAERAQKRYNMVLYRGYRAWVMKQQYLAERAEHGTADPAVADKLVFKLRDAIAYLSRQSTAQWRAGVRQFRQKGIFLKRRPKECTLSFRAYRKRLSKKEKLLPHISAFYYTYSYFGAVLYGILSWPLRFIEQNKFVIARKQKKLRERLIRRGTGKGA